MKCMLICGCILLVTALYCDLVGQGTGELDQGVVKISVPLFARDIVPEAVDDGAYFLRLKAKGAHLRIPHVGRTGIRDESKLTEYDVDNYEIRVAPGVYSIEIENLANYKLPNFKINAGQTIYFVIPQYQFAWHYICHDKQMVLRTNLDDDLDLTRGISIKPVQIETIRLEGPLFAVAYHCGKKNNGKRVTYASGRIYYKNHFFSGFRIEVDRSRLRLKVNGDQKQPVEYIVAGSKMRTAPRLTFDLRANSVVSN